MAGAGVAAHFGDDGIDVLGPGEGGVLFLVGNLNCDARRVAVDGEVDFGTTIDRAPDDACFGNGGSFALNLFFDEAGHVDNVAGVESGGNDDLRVAVRRVDEDVLGLNAESGDLAAVGDLFGVEGLAFIKSDFLVGFCFGGQFFEVDFHRDE